MFLNTQVFKKMITNAWKCHSLNIADTGSRWYIGCGFWVAWVDKAVFPKKALAAVIELAGEMPTEGRAFVAGKDMENDYSPDRVKIVDTGIFDGDGARDVKTTSVTMECKGTKLRVLQDWESWKVDVVDDIFTSLVDPEAIDTGLEAGPGDAHIKGSAVLWESGRCRLLAMLYGMPEPGTQEAFLLQELEKMDLPEM